MFLHSGLELVKHQSLLFSFIYSLIYLFTLCVCVCTRVPKCEPPPFSMPSKLLTLHGEAKSYCFTVSCVAESVLDYLL